MNNDLADPTESTAAGYGPRSVGITLFARGKLSIGLFSWGDWPILPVKASGYNTKGIEVFWHAVQYLIRNNIIRIWLSINSLVCMERSQFSPQAQSWTWQGYAWRNFSNISISRTPEEQELLACGPWRTVITPGLAANHRTVCKWKQESRTHHPHRTVMLRAIQKPHETDGRTWYHWPVRGLHVPSKQLNH